MSRILITSDLHLGHKNIHKYRQQFSSAEEHHEYVYERLATNVNKADTIYFLGDVAFTPEWLAKIKAIPCRHKKLVCGNHDRDHFSMAELCDAFDSVDAMYSSRNVWWQHCPMHPEEIRRRLYNIHGHTHQYLIMNGDVPSYRYFNACLEHTDYKPITFEEVDRIMTERRMKQVGK